MISGYTIPFNRPTRTANDLSYIQESIASGYLSGDGPFTKRCHRLLEKVTSSPKALLTTSCTHALEMAAFLLDLKAGDEVIVPAFTFVSSVNAFVIRGARPVFADVRSDTLGLDERLLERLITPRTRAIVVVHYAGIPCEMDTINQIAAAHGISVIEDNAHGLFGAYKGRPLGSLSRMATLSFHETKNVTCGEGGALLINDPSLVDRAEIIREKGTDRSRFFRGQVDKYGWVDVGSSYLPSDLLAAMLCAQLEDRAKVQARRRALWERYAGTLGAWAEQRNIIIPPIPATCDQSYHMFHVRMPSVAARNALVAHLKARSILAVSHYVPLNVSKAGRTFGGRDGECPVAEDIAERLLRLPFFTNMSDDEQATVIETLLAFS
jgi:dTDP-4-amino-4,6-dideoxygalactose transaminase